MNVYIFNILFKCKFLFLGFFLFFLIGFSGNIYALPARCINVTQTNLPPNQRPLSDWLSAQGSLLGSNINGIQFYKYIAWTNTGLSLAYNSDYAGIFACELGLPLPTIDGKITEKPLTDGTAEVTIDIHTSDAITFVVDYSALFTNPALCTTTTATGPKTNFAFCPTKFGYNVFTDLAFANGSLNPSLGDTDFRLVFINNAPNAPLPDLVNLFFAPAPGQVIKSLSYNASAKGVLHPAFNGVPDLTAGRAQTLQLIVPPGGVPAISNSPVGGGPNGGIIRIEVVGSGAN